MASSLFDTPEKRTLLWRLIRYIAEHYGGSLKGWATLRVAKLS